MSGNHKLELRGFLPFSGTLQRSSLGFEGVLEKAQVTRRTAHLPCRVPSHLQGLFQPQFLQWKMRVWNVLFNYGGSDRSLLTTSAFPSVSLHLGLSLRPASSTHPRCPCWGSLPCFSFHTSLQVWTKEAHSVTASDEERGELLGYPYCSMNGRCT